MVFVARRICARPMFFEEGEFMFGKANGIARQGEDLTEGALFPKIVKFSLPLIATGILQMLYNASDMIVVGRFASPQAMGGVGACSALINLIVNLFLGLSTGVAVNVAQSIGAKRYSDVTKYAHSALIAGAILGVALGIFGFCFAEPLLLLMKTPTNTLAEAVPYMKAYFIGLPGCMVYNYMAAVVRCKGDTKTPLVILAVSGFVNVLFNLVMVCVFGMGAIGVGIATTVAQYLSAIIIVVYLSKIDGYCRLSVENLKMDFRKMLDIIRIGVPTGIQSTLFSVSNVLIQSTVNSYGDIVIAGNAAASNIEGFAYIAMNSMHQAALTFTGQNVGAGKYERLKKIMVICTCTVAVIGLVLGIGIYLFGDPLLSLYAPDDVTAREAGMRRLSVIATTYFLCGIMDVGCGIVRGMGKAILPTVCSLVGTCVLRVVWIYTVCPLFPGDIFWLYISYPISWILTGTAHYMTALLSYSRRESN